MTSHFGMGGDIFGYGTPPEGVCSLQMERERPSNGDAERNAMAPAGAHGYLGNLQSLLRWVERTTPGSPVRGAIQAAITEASR